MKENKTKKAYILYKYDAFKNDFEYIKEYYKREEIQKDFKLKNIESIQHYTTRSIDAIKSLLDNRYIILVDNI